MQASNKKNQTQMNLTWTIIMLRESFSIDVNSEFLQLTIKQCFKHSRSQNLSVHFNNYFSSSKQRPNNIKFNIENKTLLVGFFFMKLLTSNFLKKVT